MKKRFLCVIVCLCMLLGLLPGIEMGSPVKAATVSQTNIVARADYLYNITWLCLKTVSGWCGNYTFYSGTAYRLPYGQPISSGAYIGYGVSVDSFITATKSSSNVFYTSRSTYGNTNSVYYATDCSAFVSWCWGIDRKTTYSIPLTTGVTYIGMATAANASKLQVGDCLNSNDVGHVVLVTDLNYDSSGNLTQIEITEQTPPQLKRSYYTPAQLGSYYGSYYGIYRYSGEVPSAPITVTGRYYPTCDSSYTSLYPALESIGVYCDWTLHCRIAECNGITGFTGTVAQNTNLLDLLKAGKLLNPDYVEVVYYPACGSTYTSLYPALESIGVSCDWNLHCRIAEANGIVGFSGTVEQNTQLLDLLKAGKLIDPNGGKSGTGSFANGYEKGYQGGMAGDGKIYAHGLDVSQWQGTGLDFNTIKNAGYDYVILRAGTSYGKDTCFESYYTKARNAGLDIGVYYYTYATTVSAAQTDAANMLSWISGKTFEYPIYFDYEDSSQDNLSTTTAKNICLTFCDAMAGAGYLAGVYTGYYKSTQLPMSEICAKYEVWIANYWDYGYTTLSPSYSTKYGMYQYTDRNYIGSNGPYDGDVAFKDYPAIVKQYGFNGYAEPEAPSEPAPSPEEYLPQCTVYPTHCNIEVTQTTSLNQIPCNLSPIGSAAVGQSYTATALYCNPDGEYWYQIPLATGETGYLYGGHTQFSESLSGDITLSGASTPGDVTVGTGISVSGTVSADWNRLNDVKVSVFTTGGALNFVVASAEIPASDNDCQLSEGYLDVSGLEADRYLYRIIANYSGYYITSDQEITTYQQNVTLLEEYFQITGCVHDFTTRLLQPATCTEPGILERTCTKCGTVNRSAVVETGHQYLGTTVEATCIAAGGTCYSCVYCGDTFFDGTVSAKGHHYVNGICTTCTAADPGYVPILTLKAPTLEFKDVITVNAFYTAENIANVVEMGMITYSTQVSAWSVETAEHIIPGATYVESNGRYFSGSQGIHGKYLADTVYLAIYAKLSNGTYAYSKLAGYSAVQYANSQLKNSSDAKLKKLVVAMLNYGAEAQLYFGHNTSVLANSSLNSDQLALPDTYRNDMVASVPAATTTKQGVFVNNSGFSSRKPAISFEGAFCINYFFTPKYAPSSGITLYYWNEADYTAAEVLTAANATGKLKLEGSGTGEYRGDITGIAAKELSGAVYVAAAYKDSNGTVWTSGVLGYSIGAYCSSQASKGGTIAELAKATAVYGYHAKQYFG